MQPSDPYVMGERRLGGDLGSVHSLAIMQAKTVLGCVGKGKHLSVFP